MGFESPTPIQAEAIPIILDGYDLIGCAQTGTGKTAAFLIPLIDVLDGIQGNHIKSLILCPTRELAQQIDQAAEGLRYHTGIGSIPVYGGNKGGNNFSIQKSALESGSDIVIATPGRLLQHLSLGYVDLSQLEFLILDEADRMLDMGFLGDIMRIISFMPEDRQTLLFSATMPRKIRELAKEILYKPKEINIKVSKPAEGITQMVYSIYDTQKLGTLKHIFQTQDVQSMIIFCSRKSSVDQITKVLKSRGYDVEAMHSDREQMEREKIINDFKNGKLRTLVATDILSRGIDVEGLSHVVNYDVPPDPEDYVHRIGRTARADKTGAAITFVNPDDQRRFARCEKLIETNLEKLPPPEGLGEGPEYKGFGGGRGGGGRGGGGRGGGGRKGGKGGYRKGGRNKGRGGKGGPNNKNRNQRGGSGSKPQGENSNSNGSNGNNPNKKKKRRNYKKKQHSGNGGGGTPSNNSSQN